MSEQSISDPRIEQAARLLAEASWSANGLAHNWETVDEAHPGAREAWINAASGVIPTVKTQGEES